VLAFVAFAGCSGSSEPTSRSVLEKEFQSEFGFSPGASVPVIKSRTVRVGDSWNRWMKFTYSSNTFQKVMASGFKVVTDEIANDGHYTLWKQAIDRPSLNAPTWWKTPKKLSGIVFFRENFRTDFPARFAYVWADEAEGVIYSHSSAWQ
jgi:hypothetical protein